MIYNYLKTPTDPSFKILNTPCTGCWIHVDEATPEELEHVCTLTGLHYADLHDTLDKYEIPRIEKAHDQVLIFTRYPTDQEPGLYTSTLTFILTDQYFISIAPHSSQLIQNFLTHKETTSTAPQSKLLIQLLLRIAQEFTLQIKRVRHNILRQEKEMISVDSEDITMLTKHEEVLNQYLASLDPFLNVLNAITSGKYAYLYEKDQDLLEDLFNAVTQSKELCSIVIKSIRSLRDAYQIIFTNNLHKTIKLLTALTIIFSIPTMVASLYGMNVSLPFASTPHAFILVLGWIFVVSLVGLLIFKRKRWL